MLQLADVFESFRTMCISTYGLDPAYYVSAPQLSWDAMLKITGVDLELISEPAMFRMVDSGIRGGGLDDFHSFCTREQRTNRQ